MTIGLVKLIAERDYQGAKDLQPDVRVMHCEPRDEEEITRFYETNGWTVTREEI